MADDITPLASLSITHVYYDPTDPLSTLAALLSLLPQGLCVVYATLLWSTREAEVLLLFAGQLACEAVNLVLKRLIKEERPPHRLMGPAAGRGYGMPSSHAQFVFFWAVAAGLFLCVRHRPRPLKAVSSNGAGVGDVHRAYRVGGLSAAAASIEAYSHSHWTLGQRVVVSGGGLFVAGLVAWSRVYLGYHSVRQVLAGCAAGAGCAVAWFAVTYLMREMGLVAWALDMPLARWLRMRDLVVVEDLCQAGWEKWEERRRMVLEKDRAREKAKARKRQ
ncbi:hypothetical protein CHGG_02520 [Chaetomium globosum CBS 148.51]|uniref:Dolichyldiphosphatase n=1 Tax=Chaetomium globosum (strain ATCC 6205 / CBS 148.51 / DSM 1962 / NBRC 6347 / NRRL 1970) TaxID=306901 RepID=Q2HB84_CHAGB|nr:uncharacterized protein CHGG_02520 [Chaetomium globosum CBS 148.51]EAQ90585.1 hypothetical protein CHGG_02520 [Chaetomium globosum CBS 148.51]